MPEPIVVVASLQPFLIERLRKIHTVHVIPADGGPADIPGLDAAAVRGAVTRGEARFTARFMDELPNLEVIANFGVGYDGIEWRAAVERGIVVTNTPDVLTDETANLCLSLVLAATRRIVEGDRFLRAGKWGRGDFPMGASIIGKTVGIVGLGRIGQAVARRLEVCGARVIYNDVAAKDAPWAFHPDLVEMAGVCDVLVSTCIGGPATRGLISAKVIGAMRPHAFFVNASRGTVVDEPALVKALVERKIAGAGLDVFADEPNVPAELIGLEHVVIVPHLGSRTRETWDAMADLCQENLALYYQGKDLKTPIPGALKRPARVR